MTPPAVLFLEDSDLDAELVAERLARSGLALAMERVSDRRGFVARLAAVRYDLILSDYDLPGFDGLAALALAREHQPDTPFIFVSGMMGEELAVETLKHGATDYILKQRLARLPAAIERALAESRARADESRHRLAAIVESSGDAIISTDLNSVITSWNAGAERTFGYTAEEAIGRSVMMLIPPDHADEQPHILMRIRGGERIDHYETVRRRKNGVLVHVSLTVSPIVNRHGRIVGVSKIARDITDRQRAEETLRASEEFNRSLMDASADCIKVLDMEGRVRHINALGLCLMEIDDFGPLWGQAWSVLWPAEVREDLERAVAVASGGSNYSFEAFCPTAKGSPRWWDVTVSPVRDAPGGPVVRLLSVSRDITARKQAEEKLRESEIRLDGILRRLPAGIVQTDAAGCLTLVNPRWCEMFGYTEAELLGRNIIEITHPSSMAPTAAAFGRLAAGGPNFQIEKAYCRKDGSALPSQCNVAAIRSPDGEFLGLVAVVLDISERLRTEEELRRLAAERSEADRRKDEFLATLAHELRNPLAPIRNGLEVIRLAGVTGVVEQARIMMDRQLTQLVRLVDDLLDISRVSTGKLELRKERIELKAVIETAVETSLPAIEQAGHAFAVEVPDEPIFVDGDPTRLAQVVSNLLNNSAKYTHRGGHIRLTVELASRVASAPGADVVVSVADDGIGIPPDMLEKVFGMFAQVDRTLEKTTGGLGIGLSLVKGLVEMHGGTSEARSEGKGRGSEFVVRLPLAESGARESTPAAGEVQRVEPSGSRRILVVDDNVDSADSLAQLLELLGNEVWTAHDGLAGIGAAGTFRPDVVLMDIGMPKMNGYEACRHIRGQAWGRDMILVALTGWGQDDDRRKTSDAGFDHHLVKPVETATLMGLLARKAAANA